MGNSRSFTTKYVANREELTLFLKAKKCTSRTRRDEAVERAKAGRPADLASKARISLALRRIAGSAQV